MPKKKRKIDPDTYNRVKKINDDLLSQGMTWDEIEAFWQDCIATAKKQKSLPKCKCQDVNECDVWCIAKDNFTKYH